MDSDSESEPSDSDDSSTSAAAEERWLIAMQMIKGNDPQRQALIRSFDDRRIQNITDEEWEELGRDISNNTHLIALNLSYGWLNDHLMSFFFRGLTRSSSIEDIILHHNELSIAGIRNMVPFLQNANNLTYLSLKLNNIQSEGFNLLFRALRDSPIVCLECSYCGIQSIQIDSNQIPKKLKKLYLNCNSINADGCRELAKLLQGRDATLDQLSLRDNKIDDEGVEILAGALQNNTTLECLYLNENDGISNQGKIMLLKLVNDICSIEATLQSNHTLKFLRLNVGDPIQDHIEIATRNFNSDISNPEEAAREKVIWTQLHSEKRAELAELQEVNHSVYSEIDPLHLPEVLALVDEYHGQSELYIALKSSIAGVISTVNRKECILQKRDYLLAQVAQLDAELAVIEAAEGGQGDGGGRSKRHRAC